MRRLSLLTSLLFCVLACLSCQETDATESPYFNVFSTDTTGVDFSLVSTDVQAVISGVIANVVVEQTYYNQGDSVVDATYVFPMSTQAAIYAMEMQIDDRVIVAEIRRKEEADEIFNNADTMGLTATLLEQQRPNVFQMSLANINPGDSLIVRMTYTELISPEQGVYQFVFPTIVGPRYTAGGEPWVAQTIEDSLAVVNTALNINLKINGGMNLSATCISHDATFNGNASSTGTIVNINPGIDFIVNYTLDDDEIKTGLLLYEGVEENFFLSIIQPAILDLPFESPRREYIFLVDVSGSMSGEPLDISRALITDLLNGLNMDDKFNIIFFAGSSSVLAPNSILATSDNIAMAIDLINNIIANGSTQILPALELALSMEVEEDYSRVFAILTDGFVTVEAQGFDLIRNNLGEANFFAFGIGNSVNRFIIEGIAYVGEGEPFVATSNDNPIVVAERFKTYIERPTLNNISVAFDGIDAYDVEPLTIPDVFAERPIIVYGKYNGAPDGSITLTGDLANGTISSTLDFADYTTGIDENAALPYLWARKRIKLMSDYGIASNEQDTIPIEEEITLLGLQYSLITEFTSFVAVDSNAVSSTSTGQDDDDDGGTVVETDNSLSLNRGPRDLIQIAGTIIPPGQPLKVELLNQNIFDLEQLELSIRGIDGRTYFTKALLPGNQNTFVELPVRINSPGTYFLTLTVAGTVVEVEKFIIQR